MAILRNSLRLPIIRTGLVLAGLTVTVVVSRDVLLAQPPPPNTWSPAGNMGTGRNDHTLTLLPTGEVLAAGGCDTIFCNDATASSETYDPVSRSWSPAGSMTSARNLHTATLLPTGNVLVTGGCNGGFSCDGLAGAELFVPGTRSWSAAASMAAARTRHTATLLADGRVLVTGGISICCGPIAGAEIYDAATNSWLATADMPSPRVGHTATRLPSGQVLIAGGCATNGLPCDALGAVIYDPATESWSAAAQPITERTEAHAIALPSGDVLVAGGVNGEGFFALDAERYNPATSSWIASGTMSTRGFQSTATLLTSGQVLAAGGESAAAELYLPTSVTWTPVAPMNEARCGHAAVLLANGDVLVSGGEDEDPFSGVLSSAETFRPGPSPLTTITPTRLDFGLQEVGTTSPARVITIVNRGDATLSIASVTVAGPHASDLAAWLRCSGAVPPGDSCDIEVRFSPTATRGRSASVLIVDNAPDSPHAVPLTGFGFREAPNHWAPAGTMSVARQMHTATRLPDGGVLVVGGGFSRTAELYDPASDAWSPTGSMTLSRQVHTATLLLNGRVLVAGGGTASAELYMRSTGAWRQTRRMTRSRSGHAATRLASGRVLVTGGCLGLACADAEIYDPASERSFRIAPMKLPRVGHTATLLADGRVLVVGGARSAASAEVYDPALGAWFLTGPMTAARHGHTATLLGNGTALVAGGCAGSPCAAVEVFNPNTARWTPAPVMRVPRANHTATLLGDGRVLVAGGIAACDPEFGVCFTTEAAEIYNPRTGLWTRTGSMIAAREFHTATRLHDGTVLVAGGFDWSDALWHASTERFTP